MQISLRSQLIAGTAAVVGAAAVAATPVMAPRLAIPALPVPSLGQVALAAFESPLGQLLDTAVTTTNYLFNTADPLTADQWPFADFGTFWGVPPVNYPLLPAALGTAALGGYSSVGLIPQIIDDALPIISQLGYNGSDYLQALTTSLYGAAYSLEQGIWGFPNAVVTAVGELIGGDPAAAVQTLINATIGPVIQAVTFLGSGAFYIAQNVINRAAAVIGVLPTIALGLVAGTVGAAITLGQKTISVATNVVTSLISFDLEGAWNAAVTGLLGPSGIPGTIINLTLGAGVQTGPIATPDEAGILAAFTPSTRTLVQGGVKLIAGALATPPSAAAVAVPEAAAEVEAPAAAAAVAAPEVETADGPAAQASEVRSSAATATRSEAGADGESDAGSASAGAEAADDDGDATVATAGRAGSSAKAGAARSGGRR